MTWVTVFVAMTVVCVMVPATWETDTVETVCVTGIVVALRVTESGAIVEVTNSVDGVAVSVTVSVFEGAGAVLVLGLKPMQLQAEEYW
jgi:hypothetical protein